MKSPYVAGFDHLSRNAPVLRSDPSASSDTVVNRAGNRVAVPVGQRWGLASRRAIARTIIGVTFDDVRSTVRDLAPPVDWDTASRQVTEVYLGAIPYSPYGKRIIHAGRAGISQTIAFLAVIPEVVVDKAYDKPQVDLRGVAQRSKPFIMHSAAVSDATDAGLAYGLATPKPDIHAEHPYEGLRFHPKWFMQRDDGSIGLDPTKASYIRGENGKHPNHDARPSDVWFPCPAHDIISILYDTLVEHADRGDLFVQSYETARRNIGY